MTAHSEPERAVSSRLPALRARVSPDAPARAQRVRLLALDVDGTLTDGHIYMGPSGEALKAFSVHDGFGLNLLRQAGLKLAIVTGRASAIVEQRAAELKFDAVLQSVARKDHALDELAARFGVSLDETAFIGDDWPDAPALRKAGLAAAVVSAAPELQAIAHWVGTAEPGRGAVREFAQWWLQTTGHWASMCARYELQTVA